MKKFSISIASFSSLNSPSKNEKNLISIFFIILFAFFAANSEISIKQKLIINSDKLRYKKRENYLLALNPNLRNLSEKDINRYATDSLINEYIKKIEIEKDTEILQNRNMIDKVISDLYSE